VEQVINKFIEASGGKEKLRGKMYKVGIAAAINKKSFLKRRLFIRTLIKRLDL
jgi:hypothetical protein